MVDAARVTRGHPYHTMPGSQIAVIGAVGTLA